MFEVMKAGRGGWSEWIRPMPGYLAKCCDCGLVHEMQFVAGPGKSRLGRVELTNDPNVMVMFRARRKPMAKKVKKAKKSAKASAKTVPKKARGR